jgi:ABC-type uncharacterized transport system permease subunit
VALVTAALLHLAYTSAAWATHAVGPFSSLGAALSTLGLLVVLAILAVGRSERRTQVVGAFLAPLVVLLLLASRVRHGHAPAPLGGAVLLAHIASVTVGTAAFSVAFAMSVAYLLQERQVKTKRLGGLFQRLPSLEVLDSVAWRSVAVGLPALTLGIVCGLFVGHRARGADGPVVTWQQYIALGAWALFAAVLLLRVAAGWRGRRAALGTILWYLGAVLVLVGYYLREGPP